MPQDAHLSSSEDLQEVLPASHAGHGYTRLCVASLRRSAQKMPTLSGVADHLEALGSEVASWEARARDLHGMALGLRTRCQELEAVIRERSNFTEGMIEDFCGQRQAMDDQIQELRDQLVDANRSLEGVSEDLRAARQELGGVRQELVSFRAFHDAIVRDLDASEARAQAQVAAMQGALDCADQVALEALAAREDEANTASELIVSLMGRMEEVDTALEGALAQVVEKDARIFDLQGELRARIADHTMALERQSSEMDMLVLARDESVQSLARVSQRTVDLEQELSFASLRIQNDHARLVEREEALERAQQELTLLAGVLDQERATHGADQAALVAQIEQLRQQLSGQEDLLAHSRAQLSALQQAMEQAQSISSAQARENEDLTSRLALFAAQLEQEEQARLMSEREAAQVPALQASLTQANEAFERAHAHAATLTCDNEALSSRLHSLLAQAEVDRLSFQALDAHRLALEGDLNAAQELLEEEIHRARTEREQHALALDLANQRSSHHQAAEERLLEERAALELSQNEVQRLAQALSDAQQSIGALQQQADRASELDIQVSALHELLQAQSAELDRVEGERKSQALLAAGHDDSLPWTLRPLQAGVRPCFQPVAGVKSWLERNGWTAQDLGPARFPGYSAADREHLAMATGLYVDEFLSLPFVRDFIKQQVSERLSSDHVAAPPSFEGEWVLVGGVPRWRTNRLWKHLVAVSEESSLPPAWTSYLEGSVLGV